MYGHVEMLVEAYKRSGKWKTASLRLKKASKAAKKGNYNLSIEETG